MHDYFNEITPFINDITSQTKSGTIHWKRINPTTFYWTKDVSSGKVRTTIQKVEGPKREYFRLEVKDTDSGEEIISIDTRESSEIQPIVQELYNAVENYTYQNQFRRDEILRELLQR